VTPLGLTIYITDEPLGLTGYGSVTISPVLWVCVSAGLALLALIGAYFYLRPTPTVPPGGRQP